MKKATVLCITCLLITLSAVAQKEKSGSNSGGYRILGAYFDEDYLVKKPFDLNRDRNYTLGFSLFYGDTSIGKCFVFWPLRKINHAFGYKEVAGKQGLHLLKFTNGSYTPGTISTSDVIEDDRPYASVTSFQMSASSFKGDSSRRRVSSQLSIGFLGTNLANWAQTTVHKIKGDPTPQGWHHQISKKGEPTMLYTYQYDRLIGKRSVFGPAFSGIQAKHGFRYMLGYYTAANYFFQFKTGRLNPLNWAEDVNNLQEIQGIVNDSPKKFEAYFFGAMRPQFMLYNALLNGQFRDSGHTINFQQMRHLILEADAGVGLTMPNCEHTKALNLKFRYSVRSPEFRIDPRPERWHFWGGAELSFAF